jgi:hypothetical protein
MITKKGLGLAILAFFVVAGGVVYETTKSKGPAVERINAELLSTLPAVDVSKEIQEIKEREAIDKTEQEEAEKRIEKERAIRLKIEQTRIEQEKWNSGYKELNEDYMKLLDRCVNVSREQAIECKKEEQKLNILRDAAMQENEALYREIAPAYDKQEDEMNLLRLQLKQCEDSPE